MISIVPADEATRDAILQSAPFSEKKTECLIAVNRNEQLGYILYRYNDNTVDLLDLKAKDEILGDGLLRAALNSAIDIGIKSARCEKQNLFSYVSKLGFHKSEEKGKAGYQAEIQLVLKCQCHKNTH